MDDQLSVIYDAAVGEHPWEEALKTLSDAVGGAKLFAGWMARGSNLSFEYWTCNFDAGSLAEFGFDEADMFSPQRNPITAAVLAAPIGVPFDRREYVPDDVFERDDFLQAGQALGIYHSRHAAVARRTNYLSGLWIGREKSRGAVEGAAANQFDAWLPHIRRAFALRSKLQLTQISTKSFTEVLFDLSVGVVVINNNLRIHVLNAVAEDILASQDGISVEAGRLAIPPSAGRQAFHGRLRAIAVPSAGRPEPRHDEAVYLPRPSGLPPWSVTVLPATGVGTKAQLPGALATLIVSDPMRRNLPSEGSLCERFGLTRSEAKVARLAPLALSKRQIAEQLGLSENTVKSHLAHAREKIGARNMTELGLIVGRSPLS